MGFYFKAAFRLFSTVALTLTCLFTEGYALPLTCLQATLSPLVGPSTSDNSEAAEAARHDLFQASYMVAEWIRAQNHHFGKYRPLNYLYPVALAVVRDYQTTKRALPVFMSPEAEILTAEANIDRTADIAFAKWVQAKWDSQSVPTFTWDKGKTPEKIKFVEKGVIAGRTKFFRPLSNQRLARTTYVASTFNHLLGLDTVANARIAALGQAGALSALGILSDQASGLSGEDRGYRKSILRLEFPLDFSSLLDTWAYEFLIGNNDVNQTNYFIADNGKFTVIDSEAFDLFFDGLEIGGTPPPRYTRGFVDALKQFTEEKIRAAIGMFLTENELQSLLFRRAIILKDIESRGDPAIFIQN